MTIVQRLRRPCGMIAVAAILLVPGTIAAQANAAGPWFGVMLPPSLGATPPISIGTRGPAPVHVPAGEEAHVNLEGERIRRDLDAIVAFATRSREQRELGSGQLWGRVAGFPSNEQTIAWSVEQFRAAGIEEVEVQTFDQTEGSSLWLPTSWEVRLLGSSAFGPGSQDVVLESAMPLNDIPGGLIEAPIVFVGSGHASIVSNIDVQGKIAIQQVIPQGHTVFERGPTAARAQNLMALGAVAVVNLIRQPGNEHARDLSNCGGPCLNLGGRDGFFLEQVMDRAAENGVLDDLRLRITVASERRSGLRGENGIAIIRGRNDSENMVINAHVDSWFDGAGDNGDGLAVMIALARHFARPENTPERTLVFVASAGHHTTGLSGPRNFLAMNPEITSKTVLMLNLEHVAQRNYSPSRIVGEDGYREYIADSGEAPINVGISNRAPFLEALMDKGVQRYGVNFVSEGSDVQSGEASAFSVVDAARVHIIQAPPLYHTSGERADVISTPGLERMARFFAYFIDQVGDAPTSQIKAGI